MSEVLFIKEMQEIKKLLQDQNKIHQQQLIAQKQNNDLLIQLIEALADEGMIDEEEQPITYLNSRA